MVKHVCNPAPLLLGCALYFLSLLAGAQNPPSENEPQRPGSGDSSKTEQSDPSKNLVIRSGMLSGEQADKFHEQLRQQQAELRARLADPKQRAQMMASRIELERALHRDLAALLRLDPRTENRLLTLLADQRLSEELQPPGSEARARIVYRGDDKPDNPLRIEAERYTQRMTEISKIVGAARLDDYVDYERKLGSRAQVSRFEAVLPAEGKLTLEQRSALTDLFQDHRDHADLRVSDFDRSVLFDSKMTAEERNRRLQLLNIARTERHATIIEAANRELVDRAASLLTPEQTQALADLKQQELDQLRASTQAQRKAFGIAPEERLDDLRDRLPYSRPISKNLRLTIDVTVNETRMVKQLTSVRGSSVSFEAPESLMVEVRPYLGAEKLNAEVRVYEKVPGGHRLVGQLSSSAVLVDTGKPSAYGGFTATIVQGRKGYVMNWSVIGTYL